LEELGR